MVYSKWHNMGSNRILKKGGYVSTSNINYRMSKKEENKSFEELMETLEEIVQELEKGNLNLDESVEKFEEGMKISKECNKILENSEKRISILLENDGTVTEEDFDA